MARIGESVRFYPGALRQRLSRLDWNVQVWICRRFLHNMTLRKMAVLSHVTGMPVESILAMHPSCRTSEELSRVIAKRVGQPAEIFYLDRPAVLVPLNTDARDAARLG